ncbi:DUF4249 domain-containing protein [Reichenbachiella ulvae]|uniref:DUF4249 domain-containing protein n=1 Tax=Reichenbachiella ulvae TaxID=2980104 RepID=A0ABT3CX69_9BACT|nr:DUF4249 domain-containing protein [Reichenbachiella ulvae]MCV9388296.1 DUF4249 domain-containing protein [Reichenbachiella ulvae]
MKNKFTIILIALFWASCISTYEFEVNEVEKALVVEGFISDQSYSDLNMEPTDPRYFDIKLSWTGQVKNSLNEKVRGAEVIIHSDQNQSWDYSETDAGVYQLFYEDFKAEQDQQYQLEIILPEGDVFYSEWVGLPSSSLTGTLKYEEIEKDIYSIELGEEIIIKAKGLQLKVDMPENITPSSTEYYKWDFDITYGFVARLNPTQTDPNYRCWITEELFYPGFEVAEFDQPGTSHEMVFVNTAVDKIHEGLSVLVRQHAMAESYFSYWNDIKRQEEQEGLFAPPPYNLKTNMSSNNPNVPVYGYFGAVSESYYRWIFNPKMVSYNIIYPESLRSSCNIPLPPPSCYDCRQAELVVRSRITNQKPWWWNN